MDLKNVYMTETQLPPKILIYGFCGTGKTTLASEFPNPIFIQTEDGIPSDVHVATFGKIKTYDEFMDCLRALYKEDHSYKTVVIDSITVLEKLINNKVIEEERKNNYNKKINTISDLPWGKGSVEVKTHWQSIVSSLEELREKRKVNIVLLGHAVIGKCDDLIIGTYSRYSLELSEKSLTTIELCMDMIIFMRQDIAKESSKNVSSNGEIIMHFSSNPSFIAKNRYNIDGTIRYIKGGGFKILSEKIPFFAK